MKPFRAVVPLALMLFAWAGEPAEPALEQLAWLAGTWSGEANGVLSEEHWTVPAGGLMLGTHRDVSSEGGAFFEYLRIERREDGIYYVASPMGRPGTDFRMVAAEGTRVEFHNPDHDFPRTIVYRLDESGDLHVRAEGVGGDGRERSSTWVWRRAP